jgi:hypothetical protein
MQMGSAIKSLSRIGFWPCHDPATYNGSVFQLATNLESVKISRYYIPGMKPHQDEHRGCELGHADAIRTAMNAPVPLSSFIVARLRENGKISGAYDDELFKHITVSVDQVVNVQTEEKLDNTLRKQNRSASTGSFIHIKEEQV